MPTRDEIVAEREKRIELVANGAGVTRSWAEIYVDVLEEWKRKELIASVVNRDDVDLIASQIGKSPELVIKAIAALMKAGLISKA